MSVSGIHVASRLCYMHARMALHVTGQERGAKREIFEEVGGSCLKQWSPCACINVDATTGSDSNNKRTHAHVARAYVATGFEPHGSHALDSRRRLRRHQCGRATHACACWGRARRSSSLSCMPLMKSEVLQQQTHESFGICLSGPSMHHAPVLWHLFADCMRILMHA